MSLLTRKSTILAKIESVYGTDPTPTGEANAMLVRNLNVTPLEAELVDRGLYRPYLGNSEQLIARKFSRCEFEIEMVAAGTIGKVPAYDALLRACGMSGAATTTSITAAIASEVVTVTKASHGLVTGDRIIPSGFTDTACNIAAGVAITKINDNSFTYPAAGAVDDASADGTPVYRTGYVYSPISASFESATIYFNADGVLHKLLGCRGTVEMSLSVSEIPTFKFSFTGLYSAPSDAAAPSVDYSSFMIPQVANTQNTPSFSLAGYSALLKSVGFNVANQVEYISYIGEESVKILERKPAGTFLLEAPLLASKDFFDLATDQTPGAMSLTHGSNNGYKVKIDAPSVLIGNPSYQDDNGIQMLSIPFTAQPTSSGNDEFTITVK